MIFTHVDVTYFSLIFSSHVFLPWNPRNFPPLGNGNGTVRIERLPHAGFIWNHKEKTALLSPSYLWDLEVWKRCEMYSTHRYPEIKREKRSSAFLLASNPSNGGLRRGERTFHPRRGCVPLTGVICLCTHRVLAYSVHVSRITWEMCSYDFIGLHSRLEVGATLS